MPAWQQFAVLAQEMNGLFIERAPVIRAAMIALAAREHMVQIGSPGTAKSATTHALCSALGGGYWQLLMTRFTMPEEVFGPISIKGLEDDRYERVVQGYLPTARIAFLDECFKANSAILNSLLTIANERRYDNGGKPYTVPLESLFGASNELPQDAALGALYDRFMIRMWVDPVSEANAPALFAMNNKPKVQTRLTTNALGDLQAATEAVVVPAEVAAVVVALRGTLNRSGIEVSDRRFMKAKVLVKASAALAGREVATPDDCAVLASSFWQTPDQRSRVAQETMAAIGAAARGADPNAGTPANTPGIPPGVNPENYMRTEFHNLNQRMRSMGNQNMPQLARDIRALLAISHAHFQKQPESTAMGSIQKALTDWARQIAVTP